MFYRAIKTFCLCAIKALIGCVRLLVRTGTGTVPNKRTVRATLWTYCWIVLHRAIFYPNSTNKRMLLVPVRTVPINEHTHSMPVRQHKLHHPMHICYTNLRTTTMGLSLPVTTISPFHIISAEETIIPKLRTWYRNCNRETTGQSLPASIRYKYELIFSSLCDNLGLPVVCSYALHHQMHFATSCKVK
jgi:hypothetical protein